MRVEVALCCRARCRKTHQTAVIAKQCGPQLSPVPGQSPLRRRAGTRRLPSRPGFDSFLQAPKPRRSRRHGCSSAAPWPMHRFFRTVEYRHDVMTRIEELYEHWLSATIDATRSHVKALVFLDAWMTGSEDAS